MALAKQKVNVTARKMQPSISARIDSAKTVAVSGDFNNWDPIGTPLKRNSEGKWSLSVELDPGEYQYRLLVDGQWHDHPEARKRVPNPFGTENCVLTVE